MPTNLYGVNDNFDLANSHVLPALIRKVHEAKADNASTVTVWGTGEPLREFLYVDDLADALIFLMHEYDRPEFINVGTGEEISIKELALTIKAVVGYDGDLVFDTSKPDGTPRKLMDVSRLKDLGWQAQTGLKTGIEKNLRLVSGESRYAPSVKWEGNYGKISRPEVSRAATCSALTGREK